MRKVKVSVLLLSCVVATSAIFIQPKSAHACLVEPCPFHGSEIPVNFGNTLVYAPDRGECTVRATNGRVIQRITSCRQTWHQIVYTANKLLFYDRSAGEIEIYNVNSRGIANRLQRFTHAQHRVRKTWAQVASPREGVITFRDDNSQVENYRLADSGMLVRISS